MFRQKVCQTMMTSEAANNFFQYITGDNWNGDVSFVSTLRALVAPRMQEGERLNVVFGSTRYSAQEISSVPAKNAVKVIFNAYNWDAGTIMVHTFANQSQEDNYASLELLKSTFESTYPGWHRLEKVTDFFRKRFYALCFIHPETKRVALFIDNLDLPKLHYLQCAVFAFLPWYFDPEKGVSEEEMALIESLRDKSSSKYEKCIARFAEKYDFKTARVRQLLAGFETRFERRKCEELRTSISTIDSEIDRLSDSISSYLRQRRDSEATLLGLELKIEQDNGGESEIMDYFLSNDKLILERVTNSEMVFVVKANCEYFDEDMAKSIIDKPGSYVYRPAGRACNAYIQSEDMKRLMYAIFIDQTVKLRFCAAYSFNIGYQSVGGIRGYGYGAECAGYMPNTHIDKFSCMGSYQNTINRMLKDNNYISAIEQCIASCKSLNFADSTVMSEFMCRMYGLQGHTNVNNRCLELPNGQIVTPKEAADWLREQECGSNE